MKPLRAFLFVVSLIGCVQIVYSLQPTSQPAPNPTEAPTGFDNQTNGHVDQTAFAANQAIFNEHEEIEEGLGPLFNADSCGGCHQNPVPGGSSQVTELRAGHYDGASFVDHPGGSLINDRSLEALIQ